MKWRRMAIVVPLRQSTRWGMTKKPRVLRGRLIARKIIKDFDLFFSFRKISSASSVMTLDIRRMCRSLKWASNYDFTKLKFQALA